MPTLLHSLHPQMVTYGPSSHIKATICLCLSPVCVVNSRLLESHSRLQSATSPGSRMLLKSLDCVFHSYEWERSSSFWCTVFGVETIQAQLNGAAISMETKPSNIGSKLPNIRMYR